MTAAVARRPFRRAAKRPPAGMKPERDMPNKVGVSIYRPQSLEDRKFELVMARLEAPFGFPESGTVLISWMDCPGDNKQRSQHKRVKQNWHELVRRDFTDCMALQPHPGVLENPKLFCWGHVGSAGDSVMNGWARYKHFVDLLQPLTLDSRERRTGCLGLIRNDKDFKLENVALRETAIRKKDENGLVHRKVILYVWEGSDA